MKQFGVVTVAEGIETEEQVEVLRRIGCDIIQGFVFYRPMPEDQFEKLLKEQFDGNIYSEDKGMAGDSRKTEEQSAGRTGSITEGSQEIYYSQDGEFA